MIERAFNHARRERRAAFIPYVMAGDPDLATTQALLEALTAAGADAIELGIPYSDPLADGPTIASAGARALANGTRMRDVLSLARECSGRCAPLLVFSYYNPIDRFGIARFVKEVASCGAAGVIVPDVTLEEAGELHTALHAENLAMPLLISPSTPRERAARIAAASTGFIYVVSRLGVTGAGHSPAMDSLRSKLAMLRELTGKPLAVGFGLRSAEDVSTIAGHADGIIVGSAVIDAYAGSRGAQAARRVKEFVAPLIAAIASAGHHPAPQ